MGFFNLEIGYIILALFFLAITAYVTTRSFMPKVAFKRGMTIMIIILSSFILLQYYFTINRMNRIAESFNSGKTILCESKGEMQGARAIIIKKSSGWSLKKGIFTNPMFIRDFHSAMCALDIRQ